MPVSPLVGLAELTAQITGLAQSIGADIKAIVTALAGKIDKITAGAKTMVYAHTGATQGEIEYSMFESPDTHGTLVQRGPDGTINIAPGTGGNHGVNYTQFADAIASVAPKGQYYASKVYTSAATYAGVRIGLGETNDAVMRHGCVKVRSTSFGYFVEFNFSLYAPVSYAINYWHVDCVFSDFSLAVFAYREGGNVYLWVPAPSAGVNRHYSVEASLWNGTTASAGEITYLVPTFDWLTAAPVPEAADKTSVITLASTVMTPQAVSVNSRDATVTANYSYCVGKVVYVQAVGTTSKALDVGGLLFGLPYPALVPFMVRIRCGSVTTKWGYVDGYSLYAAELFENGLTLQVSFSYLLVPE